MAVCWYLRQVGVFALLVRLLASGGGRGRLAPLLLLLRHHLLVLIVKPTKEGHIGPIGYLIRNSVSAQ